MKQIRNWAIFFVVAAVIVVLSTLTLCPYYNSPWYDTAYVSESDSSILIIEKDSLRVKTYYHSSFTNFQLQEYVLVESIFRNTEATCGWVDVDDVRTWIMIDRSRHPHVIVELLRIKYRRITYERQKREKRLKEILENRNKKFTWK